MSGQPRTEAGKRLDIAWPGTHLDRLAWREAIVAIEADAARAANAERDGLDVDLLSEFVAERVLHGHHKPTGNDPIASEESWHLGFGAGVAAMHRALAAALTEAAAAKPQTEGGRE